VTAPATRHGRLTLEEFERLPVYVQEELYRLNMRLEEAAKLVKRMRGKSPGDFAIATVSMDLEQRQELPLDGAVRWQFGRKWSNAIDVRRGIVERRTIRVYGVGGTLAVLPDGGCNVVTIRLEDR
jgi:hypothetical protein